MTGKKKRGLSWKIRKCLRVAVTLAKSMSSSALATMAKVEKAGKSKRKKRPKRSSKINTSSSLYSPKKKADPNFRRPKVHWVPSSKDGPGHWVRPNVGKMNEQTLDRLTRTKNAVGFSKEGSSATGKYLLPGGGRFSNANPKGEFDWVVSRAKQTPGPNQYKIKVNEWGTGGIKISDANPKSEIDWVIYRGKSIPAPNAYGLIKMPGPSGGQFSTAFPMSELDRTILRANDTPGPNQYKVDLCPTYPKSSRNFVGQVIKEAEKKQQRSRRAKGK